MKHEMISTIQKYATILLLLLAISSCGDDDTPEVIDPPFASYTFEVDETNTLMVSFTNTSIDGDSFLWNFGDGTGTSTEENPTYTYTASGTYSVTLTVTNGGGSDDNAQDVTVSGFGPNLIANGDMSTETGWTSSPLWTADDNATSHRYENGTFVFQNAEDPAGGRYQWSNHTFYQEVQLTAGGTYQFSADVSSTSGTNATWFEVYLVKEAPVDESNIGGDATQIAIKSFGDGENCTSSAFNGDFLTIAASCPAVNDFSKLIKSDGQFTVTSNDLSATGSIFLVFKAGSGFAADGETAGFNDGIVLDNVVIKEVL
ncbi:MAG: hypothetical protein Roseis2KO_27330 [Roseivirga sp.]